LHRKGSYSIFVALPFSSSDVFLNTGIDIYAGNAGERIVAGDGNDIIDIGAGFDALGQQGDDNIIGNGLDNIISGGVGEDMIDGKGGADTIFGDAAMDALFGDIGNDLIRGGAGNDLLDGGPDSDGLIGGAGKDVMSGGTEGDNFILRSVMESRRGANRDVIKDFSLTEDAIDLRAIDARAGGTDNVFNFIGAKHFHHKAGELRYVQIDAAGTVDDETIVEGDVNGDGRADFQIELTGLYALLADNFEL
jgi:Ca2+-binding RTX toxin-like protein